MKRILKCILIGYIFLGGIVLLLSYIYPTLIDWLNQQSQLIVGFFVVASGISGILLGIGLGVLIIMISGYLGDFLEWLFT